MSGTVDLRLIQAEVDASPGDIFSRLQFGAMLFLEAHTGLWAISLDGLYMNLRETAGQGLAEVGVRQGMVELTGYRVSKLFGVAVGYRVLSMDYESGSFDDLFKYDVTTFGPQLGVSFHF